MHSSNTRQLARLSIETCGQCVVVVFVCVWGGGQGNGVGTPRGAWYVCVDTESTWVHASSLTLSG